VRYFFVEKGNVTTYEWKHGEPPLKTERESVTYTFDEDGDDHNGEEGSIDFGDLGAGDEIQLETGEVWNTGRKGSYQNIWNLIA